MDGMGGVIGAGELTDPTRSFSRQFLQRHTATYNTTPDTTVDKAFGLRSIRRIVIQVISILFKLPGYVST